MLSLASTCKQYATGLAREARRVRARRDSAAQCIQAHVRGAIMREWGMPGLLPTWHEPDTHRDAWHYVMRYIMKVDMMKVEAWRSASMAEREHALYGTACTGARSNLDVGSSGARA